MPLFSPVRGVTVLREGQRVYPTLNKPFPFTDDEVTELDLADPGVLMPVDVAAARAIVSATTAPETDSRPAPKGKGKSKAGSEDLDDL